MFGIWGHPKAAEITYYGLHAMQHRGQDGAGIVVSDGEQLKLHKDIGLVNDVFKRVEFDRLNGFAAIGHVRNATQDDGNFDNRSEERRVGKECRSRWEAWTSR